MYCLNKSHERDKLFVDNFFFLYFGWVVCLVVVDREGNGVNVYLVGKKSIQFENFYKRLWVGCVLNLTLHSNILIPLEC